MKRQYFDEIKAVIILACALILLASLVSFVPEDLSWYASPPNVKAKNIISIFGAYLAGIFLFIFGYSSYLLVAFLFFWSLEKFYSRQIQFSFSRVMGFGILSCVGSCLLSMLGPQADTFRFHRSGLVGFFASDFLIKYCGRLGAFIILITLGILALILSIELLVSPFLFKVFDGLKMLMTRLRERFKGKAFSKPAFQLPSAFQAKFKTSSNGNGIEKENKPKEIKSPRPFGQDITANKESLKPKGPPAPPRIRLSDAEKEVAATSTPKPQVIGNYQLPTLDLLDEPPPISARKIQGDLMDGAKVLETTLADFGVSVRVADIERGPVITRYELEPAPGVKVQRITTLTDDIALAMRAQTVRIVAPIPGKNRVGVEVPNLSTSLVFLKEVLSSDQFRNNPSKLALALGKDIAGEPLVADLSDMPHLLIAGTTGSGKTVCLNSLIMGLLFKAGPDDLKLLMVDPKMVELSIYNSLPHALCPAVTDPKKVSAALNWVVGEMENRYTLLAKEGVRNISEYNKRGSKLPYIVVVVDELADLMQLAAKQIESAITRLAQLSRAVGIHLILATQRPSVDVITGVIKANFPARVSFKVASKVDSRTVLDMNGAESLLGKGDMLFLKPGEAKPIRGQCSLVSDQEIQKLIEFVKTQQAPIYDDSILQKQTSGASGAAQEKDELYDEALRLVIETNQASVSILQRRMRLGYTRAARLIDMMEQEGIVGSYCGSKPREILVNREEWLMKDMKKN